jgi:uncharacterized protein YllA (UPF0747 family)
LFADIIRDEVLEQRAEKVLQPQLEWLEQNYSVQAKPRPINFFYIQPGSRDRIVRDGEGFTTANQLANFNANEMEKEISAQPERFSPNVFFRPLFQEYILPNLGFIGGAGELSYWLELKPLFDYYQSALSNVIVPQYGYAHWCENIGQDGKTEHKTIGLFWR